MRLPRNRRRFVVGICIASVMILVGLTVLWWMERTPQDHGPLTLGDYPTTTGFPVNVGETATWGSLVLRNTGNTAARIDRIELVPEGDVAAAKIVDIRVVDLAAYPGPLTGTDRTFTPPAQSIPAKGALVQPSTAPGHGYEILFGIQMIRTGDVRFRRVRIDYHIGSTRYHVNGEHRFILCAPSTDQCKP
jgi:hypothetical protein